MDILNQQASKGHRSIGRLVHRPATVKGQSVPKHLQLHRLACTAGKRSSRQERDTKTQIDKLQMTPLSYIVQALTPKFRHKVSHHSTKPQSPTKRQHPTVECWNRCKSDINL
eukprot:TRINITY_DN85997_c0_g1_i1.p1 TRINITY_DN85997_c0_g1~~TRINITY_DN85997_c0_g1_i1.p1  ORF type:complete len:112 (+),score=4.81 TRINITY_DN85997_c0_g1_i1:312-647(+)